MRFSLMLCVMTIATAAGCQPQPVNHASAAAGATISGPVNASGSRDRPNCVIDGEVGDYGPSHGYAWAWLDTPTVITFAAPTTIDTVEILLQDGGRLAYSYRVSVSPDGETWREVADTTAAPVSGYQLHQFDLVEACALRLDFTDTTLPGRSYHLIEVAAYHLGKRVEHGPLYRRWERKKRERAQAYVALLGVPEAQEALGRGINIPDTPGAATTLVLSDGTRALATIDAGHTVMYLDDDGDMSEDSPQPDTDNDCIAVDMDRDGVLDRTIDYDDLDGDGHADRMVQTYTGSHTWGRGPFMVLIRDFDRGPLSLWALHDYGYNQSACQWHCDFGGDGYFVMFRHSRDERRWYGVFEAPFCFYDPDGDLLAEETVRLTTSDTTLRSARYGINADNDETEGQLYDYDLGITCLGRVEIPEDARATFTHRGGDEAGPFLAWEDAREAVRAADWERALMIWDENDHNTASRRAEQERWEGIINLPYRGFPQEGGPPTQRHNKRFELDADFSGRMQLYYWPADGRLHLLGAEEGSIEADWDYDDRVDMRVQYRDTDDDGRFDQRVLSWPDSQLPDWILGGPDRYSEPIICDYAAVSTLWQPALRQWLEDSATLLEALDSAATALGIELSPGPMHFYHNATESDFPFIDRHRASDEARRWYQDLAIELAFAELLAATRDADGRRPQFEHLRWASRRWHAGNPAAAASTLDSARWR